MKKGSKHSPETIKKMSGKPRSLEIRKKISESHKGKTVSLETRRKISKTVKRKKLYVWKASFRQTKKNSL